MVNITAHDIMNLPAHFPAHCKPSQAPARRQDHTRIHKNMARVCPKKRRITPTLSSLKIDGQLQVKRAALQREIEPEPGISRDRCREVVDQRGPLGLRLTRAHMTCSEVAS